MERWLHESDVISGEPVPKMMEAYMYTKAIYRGCLAAAVACSAIAAIAQPFDVKEDAAQLNADKAALQRQLKQLDRDEAMLKADRVSGRMAAESKDSYMVYRAQDALEGERNAIAADKAGSLQLKADKEALRRESRRLEQAEARLKADTAEGKMAAESTDAERVYRDQLAVHAEQKQIVVDEAKLLNDRKS